MFKSELKYVLKSHMSECGIYIIEEISKINILEFVVFYQLGYNNCSGFVKF